MPVSKNKVRLVLTSTSVSPEQISSALGIMPDKTWLCGERVHPRALNTHKQNGWVLHRVGSDENELEEEIESFLSDISSKVDLIAALPPEVCVELSCVVYVFDSLPSMSLSASSVGLLARMRASIDFDVYLLDE